MRKPPQGIAAKIVEIYGRIRFSDTPFSVLGMETTRLIASRQWTAVEVEHVSREVPVCLSIMTGLSRAQKKPCGTS